MRPSNAVLGGRFVGIPRVPQGIPSGTMTIMKAETLGSSRGPPDCGSADPGHGVFEGVDVTDFGDDQKGHDQPGAVRAGPPDQHRQGAQGARHGDDQGVGDRVGS